MDQESSIQRQPQKRPLISAHPKPTHVDAEVINMNDSEFNAGFNTHRGPARGRGRGQPGRHNNMNCKWR